MPPSSTGTAEVGTADVPDSDFTGTIVKLDPARVAPGSSRIVLNIGLPKGYQFNDTAPFAMHVNQSTVVTVASGSRRRSLRCALHASSSIIPMRIAETPAKAICTSLIQPYGFTGTHSGPLMGVPATGKPISVLATGIFRVVNGKLAENWVNLDALSLMQQIGAVPAPGQAPA